MITTRIYHSRRSFRHSPFARNFTVVNTLTVHAKPARHLYRVLRKAGLDAIDARCEVLLAAITLKAS